MTETINTGSTTTFPCSTLPPPPKPNDIASSGTFLKSAVKAIVRWWANNGLSFAYETDAFGVPATFAYSDGKAVVAVRAPWRKIKPDLAK